MTKGQSKPIHLCFVVILHWMRLQHHTYHVTSPRHQPWYHHGITMHDVCFFLPRSKPARCSTNTAAHLAARRWPQGLMDMTWSGAVTQGMHQQHKLCDCRHCLPPLPPMFRCPASCHHLSHTTVQPKPSPELEMVHQWSDRSNLQSFNVFKVLQVAVKEADLLTFKTQKAGTLVTNAASSSICVGCQTLPSWES